MQTTDFIQITVLIEWSGDICFIFFRRTARQGGKFATPFIVAFGFIFVKPLLIVICIDHGTLGVFSSYANYYIITCTQITMTWDSNVTRNMVKE
jgi:hypothetical protein